jgi:hypothetical protein
MSAWSKSACFPGDMGIKLFRTSAILLPSGAGISL